MWSHLAPNKTHFLPWGGRLPPEVGDLSLEPLRGATVRMRIEGAPQVLWGLLYCLNPSTVGVRGAGRQASHCSWTNLPATTFKCCNRRDRTTWE